MFEKLIALFERAVVALEKIAVAPGAAVATAPTVPETGTPKRVAKSKAVVEEKPPVVETPPADFLDDSAAEPEVTYTKADVRAVLIETAARLGEGGSAKAQAILKSAGGAETLGTLAEDKFAAVVAAAKAAK